MSVTPSYNHDAEVLVYNYKSRVTEPDELAATSISFSGPPSSPNVDPLSTDTISLREAITSITVNKTKGQPQGTFAISLKPTKEWTEIIVPGSWCAIFMQDETLTDDDLSSDGANDDPDLEDNVLSPLKMIGVIIGVRVSKVRDGNGAFSLTYTITGYDFGYALLSSIYINYSLQPDVASGKLKAPFSEIKVPNDQSIIGDPALNVQRVLQGWSVMSSDGVPGNLGAGIAAPPIRMQVPDDVADLVNSGTEVLQFISAAIGIDNRTDKSFTPGDDGICDEFGFLLAGQKMFQIWEVVSNNTLWGMINQYLNSIMNEAYCDLHVTNNPDGSTTIKPALIVRQKPYNTPDFDKYWTFENAQYAQKKLDRTMFVDLPATTLPDEKVLSYDIGYSEQERTNFIEVNAFDKDIAVNSFGAFNDINRPKFEEGSITRCGLRPMIQMGNDYGALRGNIQETGAWSPLIMDWWFNANRYASGTVELIGINQHIAIGENFILPLENILAHIESYTHTFTVDKESGNRLFRTSIDFTRGIRADSTSSQYNFIYGETKFNNQTAIKVLSGAKPAESIFEQDVSDRVSMTKLGNQPASGANPSLNSLASKIKI